MALKNTESLANSSKQTRSVFYCPESPQHVWDFHSTSYKITVALTAITCPVTILLNLLVIIAVKTRRELKTNSNILLSSVALADLLVGAVSIPLSITLNALVIQRVLLVDVICTTYFMSVFVLFTVCASSFFHLILIAWERYVAIAKWKEYKAIVTRHRVNKYTRVAWMSAFLIVVLLVTIGFFGVPYELLLVLNLISSIFWLAYLSLIAYFYLKASLAMRKWNRTQISLNVLVKGKLESKVAYTTFWLAVFFAVSGFPSVVVYLFWGVLPFSRQVSTMRWTETIFQLNSLFNPLLYWYRNRRLRKATLELLRCRYRPPARTARRIRQPRYSVASLDVEKLQGEQTLRSVRLLRSASLGAIMSLDTFRQGRNEAVKERAMSAPSIGVASDEILTQQHNKLTAPIDNATGGKRIHRKTELPKNVTELGTYRRTIGGKIVPSSSLNENSSTLLTKSHHNVTSNINKLQ